MLRAGDVPEEAQAEHGQRTGTRWEGDDSRNTLPATEEAQAEHGIRTGQARVGRGDDSRNTLRRYESLTDLCREGFGRVKAHCVCMSLVAGVLACRFPPSPLRHLSFGLRAAQVHQRRAE